MQQVSSNSGAARAPHRPLLSYYDDDGKRERFVRDLFDQTASSYDRINAWASFGLGGWYRRRTLRAMGVAPGMRLLDVAIGTGLVAREAQRLVGNGGEVIGIDASYGMLTQARQQLALPLIQGRAETLPLRTDSVDVVTMGYALRHVADLAATFAEFHRVLHSGGRVAVLEIAQPAGRLAGWITEVYLRRAVPVLARLTTGARETEVLMRYFWDTIDSCVPPLSILRAIDEAGFVDVRQLNEFGAFVAYAGRKP